MTQVNKNKVLLKAFKINYKKMKKRLAKSNSNRNRSVSLNKNFSKK